MENQNSNRSTNQPISDQASTTAIRVPTDSSPSINFHYETQEDESSERAVQSFRLDPLDPYRYYHISPTLNQLRAIIPIRQPKLKTIYKSSEITVQSISSSSKQTYLPIISTNEVTRYKLQGYKGLHLGAIQIGIQPLFLAGKDITCFIAILDTRWQTFEKALITAVEAGLNQGHVVLQVEPNFTLDIHKPSLTDAIKVLIQVNGLTMKPDESALAIHHTMTYKVQTHLFSMSSSGRPITRFLAGDGRVFQPRTYRQNQLIFPPQWINEYEKNNRPQQIHEVPKISRLQEGRVSVSFPTETKALYPCEKCQLEGKHPSLCTHMPRKTTSCRIMGPVTMIIRGGQNTRPDSIRPEKVGFGSDWIGLLWQPNRMRKCQPDRVVIGSV